MHSAGTTVGKFSGILPHYSLVAGGPCHNVKYRGLVADHDADHVRRGFMGRCDAGDRSSTFHAPREGHRAHSERYPRWLEDGQSTNHGGQSVGCREVACQGPVLTSVEVLHVDVKISHNGRIGLLSALYDTATAGEVVSLHRAPRSLYPRTLTV
jgi:hypothetical protein